MTDEINDITFCEECLYHGEPNGCNRNGGECKAYYAFLDWQAENAALRERLDKAVELPAKVGDTIYEVGGQYTKNIVPWKIREIILHSNGVRFICDCEDGGDLHRCVDVYNNEMQTFWDKSPFCLTSAAAEKRLAESGGEK